MAPKRKRPSASERPRRGAATAAAASESEQTEQPARTEASDEEEEEEEAEADYRWVGEPDRIVKGTGCTYYTAFEIDGVTFAVHDTVSVLMEAKSYRGSGYHCVAQIDELWETKGGEQLAKLNWYAFPAESALRNRGDFHEREVFLTDGNDVNEISCIDCHVRVATEEEFETVEEGDEATTYFCRYFYSRSTRSVRHLLGAASSRVGDEAVEAAKEAEATQEMELSQLSQAGEEEPALNPAELLTRACTQLQLATVPRVLPCRDQERREIFGFLEGAVQRGGLGCALYISGMPGTGKTACVLEVVRSLQARADDGELPAFQFVEINGMKLSRPDQVYSVLWKTLTGQQATAKTAVQLLEQHFSKPDRKRPCVVVLADELDLLVTRKQMVLYNLFDWPTRKHAKLVVVGIANTMDLPERLLPRVHSRIGMGRVVFSPYRRDQIEEIVTTRLAELPAFGPNAVEMAARKVAAVSGDVRRALQLCRIAARICRDRVLAATKEGSGMTLEPSDMQVSVADVVEATHEVAASQSLQALARAAPLHRVVMVAVALTLNRSGSDETDYESVAERLQQLCALMEGLRVVPSRAELLEMLTELGASRLLVIARKRGYEAPSIRLGVQLDDVRFAFSASQDPQVQKLSQILSQAMAGVTATASV